MIKFSVIIPAYNEEEGIKGSVEKLKKFLAENYQSSDYEIIVVNDGSTDKTKEIISGISGIKVVNHNYNKGYGASIKNGVKNSKHDWVLFYDADGQHNPEYIKELVNRAPETDMVIGERIGYKGPANRQPGKKVLKWTAEYLTGQKIPDINSGLRIIKKEYFNQFAHILPNGFSLSTTTTMAFLSAGLDIIYIPIKINERVGKSTVKQIKHGTTTILLILRIIMLFNPLKIFFPISAIFGAITPFFLIYDIFHINISKTSVVLFISTIMIFCFGLLADQISSIRRDDYRNK